MYVKLLKSKPLPLTILSMTVLSMYLLYFSGKQRRTVKSNKSRSKVRVSSVDDLYSHYNKLQQVPPCPPSKQWEAEVDNVIFHAVAGHTIGKPKPQVQRVTGNIRSGKMRAAVQRRKAVRI